MPFSIDQKESTGRHSIQSLTSSVITEDRPEDLGDNELVASVELLGEQNHMLQLENEVFERYLLRMDPALTEGLQQQLEQAVAMAIGHSRIHAATSLMIQPMASVASLKDSIVSGRMTPSVMKFGGASFFDKGPRVNVTQKIEMVAREEDEIQRELAKLHKYSDKARASLRAQLEETRLVLKETDNTKAQFDEMAVQEADPIRGHIVAEKFVRFMEEWLKGADSTVEKLRLRTSTMRGVNVRAGQQLQQKEELGESLHPIDFEQLKIENKDYLERIEQKNFHLLELKKMTGSCALQLNNHKKSLMEQLAELNTLQALQHTKEQQLKALEEEEDLVIVEVEKAARKYEDIKELMSNYTVPDVMDYISKKAELHELCKAVKVWERRKKIQQTVLNSCNVYLQSLTAQQRSGTHKHRGKATDEAADTE